ncbi:phosphoribosylglycinamide formyltransferase [Granulosicoccus antarcticus]|uniref:Phosphoribosylglycinamide formyltransferase n=1 Tax=Granulosicoccus antarcticus IMCC3135 TaxID=1192854 RepID=A0A2Z2NXB0_9GAMM|nr:phosphoribosylglycinamide formyltransferase [Granulosicoccus antarcticus]ASJ76092.1 Phosphoribosylglycinamide formyltransferase [Granulosicoccus antarcticus IMCC3135]
MHDDSQSPSSVLPSLSILISGRGSNMIAIAKACQSGELQATVGLVISNRPDARGIEAAREMGIETAIIDHKGFDSRLEFDQALHERLQQARPDWIVLAGFMRILTGQFVDRWQGRMLNIHPSLLPKYPGLDTHARAIAAGDSHAGASVHIVSPELDAGPVISQVKVAIEPEDTAESLAQRVLQEEHALYITALQHCVNMDLDSSTNSMLP